MNLKKPVLVQILVLLFIPSAWSAGADVDGIIRKSVENNERNWRVAPEYTYIERDAVIESGTTTRRAFKVLMIDGSPYNQLIAENGEPLSPARAASEQKKLEKEIARRRRESPAAHRRRIAAYQRDRQQENALMREMVAAFDFHLVGEESVNGRTCYVLEAEPRPGYRPTSTETRVLTGMRGKMWIDAREYQWVRVEADVFRPVAFGLFIAHVQPGTRFVLEQVPIDQDVWMPSRFITEVRATALMLWSKKYTETETYSNYHRVGAAE